MSANINPNGQDDIVVEINMTPMIDIMLVLLIIFMVSSTVMIESALDIELPKATNITSPKPTETLVVALAKDGKLSLQGKAIAFEHFEQEIVSAMKQHKSNAVVFEGDTQVEIGKMVALMDIAKKAGATSFSIAAEQTEGKVAAKKQ
ncbi:MAG: biopolymer transporter ExbD [Oligoflexia bacterium]|nr:biopolymer transporter ExbD [Oligoflexia bacterium]MBF0364358.1 biopolymer transporter ExbD [Oligoflexia bacterium]